MPNFVLTRTCRVPDRRKIISETMESRNRERIYKIYDHWWSDPDTTTIQLVERKMDSVETIRMDSR